MNISLNVGVYDPTISIIHAYWRSGHYWCRALPTGPCDIASPPMFVWSACFVALVVCTTHSMFCTLRGSSPPVCCIAEHEASSGAPGDNCNARRMSVAALAVDQDGPARVFRDVWLRGLCLHHGPIVPVRTDRFRSCQRRRAR